MADRVLKVHFETESSADSGPVSTDLTLTSPSSNPAFRSILTMSEHKRYKFVANTLQFLPDKTPKNVFIIRRFWGDQAVILKKFIDVLDFLCQNYGQVNIFLEKKELNTWFGENCVLPDGLNPPEGLKDGKFEYIDTENINSKSTGAVEGFFWPNFDFWLDLSLLNRY